LKKFFVLPTLPSNEKNSFDHHNSYNKGPNLAFFCFTKIPFNSLPTIKFPKNHITSSYHNNMPKTTKAKIWLLRTLGVNGQNFNLYSFQMSAFLMGKELLEVVDGTTPKPTDDAPAVERVEWRKKDGHAISAICETLEEQILNLVM
jgi:hypothetical protein